MIDQLASSSLAFTSLNFAVNERQDHKPGTDSPESIRKAATQFEALLMGEVLKSARESDGSGWMDNDENDAGSILSEVSEQQLSQALAAGGGLGLAKTIAAGLSKTASKTANAPAAAGAPPKTD
jgi:Rod binding domain-containing protein